MRRTSIPPAVSQELGRRLGRAGILRALTELHGTLPREYGLFRRFRLSDDEHLFSYFLAIAEGSLLHTLTFDIDDSTSPDHLLVVNVEIDSRPLGR